MKALLKRKLCISSDYAFFKGSQFVPKFGAGEGNWEQNNGCRIHLTSSPVIPWVWYNGFHICLSCYILFCVRKTKIINSSLYIEWQKTIITDYIVDKSLYHLFAHNTLRIKNQPQTIAPLKMFNYIQSSWKMSIRSQYTDISIRITYCANYFSDVQNENETPLEIPLCTYNWKDITKIGHIILIMIQR